MVRGTGVCSLGASPPAFCCAVCFGGVGGGGTFSPGWHFWCQREARAGGQGLCEAGICDQPFLGEASSLHGFGVGGSPCVDGSGASASVLPSDPPSSREGEVALCQHAGLCSSSETPVAAGDGSGALGALAGGKGPGVH